ncbi:TonB dependent receptor [compost metagenome]
MNRFLLILLFLSVSLSGFAQELFIIKGQVMAQDDKLPIPGASVYVDKSTVGQRTGVPGVVENSAIGTITDSEGRFTLSVPKGTEFLTVSFLGFNSRRVPVLNKPYVVVYMESVRSELTEVIVTGYADIQKRKNTTSSAKIEYQDVRQGGVAGIDQMLQGQIAGVSVSPLNGGPNAASKIKIRGTVSLQGTQDPLWVIDGLPIEGTSLPLNLLDKNNIDELRNLPIAGINSDDIADITILKDAAATAIYGARAANGVIVITTKKGKNGPMLVNFNANTFISERPDFGKLNLMDASQKVNWELDLAKRSDLTFRDDKGAVARILSKSGELATYRQNGFSALSQQTQRAINNLKNVQTNWGNELYQTTINQQYGVNISGGNDRADYYFSAGYYNEKGTTIGTGFERYNATLKTNFYLTKKFTTGISLFGTTSERNAYLTETDVFTNPSYYVRNVNPYLAARNADGSYLYDADANGFEDRYVPFNILEERANNHNTLSNQSLKGIVDMEYKIIPELSLKTQLGLQFENIDAEKFGDQNSYFTRKWREKTRRYNSSTKKYEYYLPVGGIIQNSEGSTFQYNWKSMVEFTKTFNHKHEIEAMVGSELRKTNDELINTKGFGFNPQTLTTQPIMFPNADAANNADFRAYQKTKLQNAFASFFSTVSYTYARRYTVFGSLRYDGSDLFGVDPKYRYLPIWSVAGAWNAKEEDFLKSAKWLSSLRVRGSYGIQGNLDKSTSPFVVGSYNNVSVLPGSNEQIINVLSPPNSKLRWEKTATINGGVDLGLVDNRVQITFDYYNRNSSDLIGLQSLPLENGFEFTNANWARVNNRGIELSISTRNIRSNNFEWSTDFNIAQNKSKVERVQIRETDWTPSKEGYPVDAVFVIKTAGLDKNGLPLFQKKDGSVVTMEEFYKLYDQYAEIFPGEISASALNNAEYRDLFTYAGNRDPKFVGGLTNRFRLGNFDLAIAASFTLKQLMTRSIPYNPAEIDRGHNYTTDVLNAWTSKNTNTSLPAIFGRDSYNGDRWMAQQFLSATGTDPGRSFPLLDIWTKEMSYVRLSSLRLGYTLPTSLASKIKANSLRLSVEGRNLFVFSSDYDGFFDPETYGNIYAQPLSRSISFGVNVTF